MEDFKAEGLLQEDGCKNTQTHRRSSLQDILESSLSTLVALGGKCTFQGGPEHRGGDLVTKASEAHLGYRNTVL